MNKRTDKKTGARDRTGVLPYPVIVSAVSGNVDAINKVLEHFEGFIAALSTRTM